MHDSSEAEPPAGSDADVEQTLSYRSDSSLPLLVQLLDQYLAELQAGQTPDRERLLTEHPELASQLEQCLAGLEFVHRAAKPGAASPTQLGDFRITREIGRGGMGVVYEAEQISLKRRIALKVLRFGAVADREAMQRFQREAETVAHLHHTNIVPIFAIGSEQDVHYYAMQFIEGHSLAEIGRQAAESDTPIPAPQVAQWGLQSAEALSHAHQRGVIHRDVKPSNLIVDKDGRIWLTDFGLAKRHDDVTLSVAGALLGTPRYMSPEQASSVDRPIDHRTDIYSLGATLYELATGRPIFDAGTPHGVISQILHSEPPPPRAVRADLPRDLETIILRCLSKEPSDRYATAQELADDLRAFLEERPIKSRRPRLPERAARWVRKHQRNVSIAGISVAASLLLVAVLLLGERFYRQAQLGHIMLSTEGPRLLAEFVDTSEEAPGAAQPTVARVSVPTSEPVDVPAGSYELRLSASGLLSETWPLEVQRGRVDRREVYLQDRFLWPPLQLDPYVIPHVLSVDDGADLILLKQTDPPSLRRVLGSTAQPAWPNDFVLSRDNAPPGTNSVEWLRLLFAQFVELPPTVVDPPPDLDGDAAPDVVVVSRNSPSLLAISGAEGELLWWFRSRRSLPPGADLTAPGPHGARSGAVVGEPAVEDLNGDDVSDMVVSVVNHAGQRWIEAVSGRTGESLWFFAVPDDATSFPSRSEHARTAARWSPQIARLDGRPLVVATLGRILVGLDGTTGAPLWPPETLDEQPTAAPSVADLDGDGRPELLLPLPIAASFRADNAGANAHSLRLVARSLPAQAPLWEKMFFPADHDVVDRGAQRWHTIADLDDDGRAEVIIPTGRFSAFGRLANWSGLEVLSGVTGETLWQRTLWPNEPQEPPSFDRVRIGPDLNGDGTQDLFTAAVGWHRVEGNRVLAMALSGSGGESLWQWSQPLADTAHHLSSHESESLDLWGTGDDGWPLLLVPVRDERGGVSTTYLLSSGSGKLTHTLPDTVRPQIADLDGDGLADLLDTRWETAATQTVARLFAIGGRMPESWKRLGIWRPAADFDGDGATDLLEFTDEVVTARSGSDGRLLWHARSQRERGFVSPPLPYGDINGDGAADIIRFDTTFARFDSPDSSGVVGHSYQTISALSGKDGEQLWVAGDVGIAGSSSGIGGGGGWHFAYPLLDWLDLDGDQRAEILAVFGTKGPHPELAVLSGEDGQLLWKTPIIDGGLGTDPDPYRHRTTDIDGDGVGDLILWVPVGENSESAGNQLRAFSGRSGDVIWSLSAAEMIGADPVDTAVSLLWPRPAVGDLDADGRAEVLTLLRHDAAANEDNCRLVVLDGRSGAILWSWAWRGYQGALPPLLVDFDGDGSRSVCFGIHSFEESSEAPAGATERRSIVILDSKGQLTERRSVEVPKISTALAVWGHADFAGDGREQLLYYDDQHIWAYRGSGEDFLWSWPLPGPPSEPAYTSLPARLVAIRRLEHEGPSEAVVWAGRQVWGLDGASGRPRWRCDVRWSPGTGFSDPPTVEILTTDDTARLPGVLCHWRQYHTDRWSTVVSQAAATDGAGRYTPAAGRPRAYDPVPVEHQAGIPLPWLSRHPNVVWRVLQSAAIPAGLPALLALVIPVLLAWRTIRGRSWMAALLLWGYAMLSVHGPFPHALASLVALAVPVALLIRAVRQRRGTLALLAAVYVALVLAPILWFHHTSTSPLRNYHAWQHWWWVDEALGEPMMVSVATLPGVVFWWCAGEWMIRRKWKALGASVAASLLLATLFAALILRHFSGREAPWSPAEYDWSGWYVIGFWGTFSVGLLLLLYHAARWMKRGARYAASGRPRPTPPAAASRNGGHRRPA